MIRVLAILLSVLAIAPIAMLAYNYRHQKSLFQAGQELELKSCRILDGYQFKLFFESGELTGHLPVATKEEATLVVLESFDNAMYPPPTVELIRDAGDHWVVDINLTLEEKRTSLTDLLRDQNLLLD